VSRESELIAVEVMRIATEADDILSLELTRPDGRPLPVFAPGAHIDVHTPSGIVRQYSLCNDAAASNFYRIAVLREPNSRGGSASLHSDVTQGTMLKISEPRNHFPLAANGPSLLLAGGIGVTPLLSMAQTLARDGADFTLHYCARSPARAAFHSFLRDCGFSQHVQFHFDDGPQDQRLALREVLDACAPGTHLYVCGPRGFMDAVLAGSREVYWPADRIHHEYFSAEVPRADDDCEFEVEIAGSGKVVRVGKNQSIIEALSAHDLVISMSCEQGVCGTCVTQVVSGIPDHRDVFMTDAEHSANTQMTPCCSRSKTPRLVLAL
jgi:vanillate O-demethylase ferredoxin subunit